MSVNEDGICMMLPILLPVTESTDLKRWVIGDCFYVLVVPMEGLINTHSMENSEATLQSTGEHDCWAGFIVYASFF